MDPGEIETGVQDDQHATAAGLNSMDTVSEEFAGIQPVQLTDIQAVRLQRAREKKKTSRLFEVTRKGGRIGTSKKLDAPLVLQNATEDVSPEFSYDKGESTALWPAEISPELSEQEAIAAHRQTGKHNSVPNLDGKDQAAGKRSDFRRKYMSEPHEHDDNGDISPVNGRAANGSSSLSSPSRSPGKLAMRRHSSRAEALQGALRSILALSSRHKSSLSPNPAGSRPGAGDLSRTRSPCSRGGTRNSSAFDGPYEDDFELKVLASRVKVYCILCT